MLQSELQCLPVDPPRLRKATARLGEVGSVIRCAGRQRDIAGLSQAGDAMSMRLLGHVEVAPRPVCQRQEQRCRTPPDVVVIGQEIQHAARMQYCAVQIAQRLGTK